MGQIVWDSKERNIKKFLISSIKNCLLLIEFFDKYPLKSSKFLDFQDFKKALLFWSDSNNHSSVGVNTLINLTKNMNNNRDSFSRFNFLNNSNSFLYPYWIVGFIDGEGCFYCYIQKNVKTPIIQLSLEISQSAHDWLILDFISKFFSSGRLKLSSNAKLSLNGTARLIFMNKSDLVDKLIPFFNTYSLKTKKLLDFKDWETLIKLKIQKKHLSEEGLDEIKKIKEGMNSGRSK